MNLGPLDPNVCLGCGAHPSRCSCLHEFLLARISEDEEAAQEATPGPWHWRDPGGRVKQALLGERGEMIVPSASGDVYPSVYDAEHIARHDPARVLAECQAKRRIVMMQAANDEDCYLPGFHYKAQVIENVLRLLALPYADHPDYRQEWRP